MEQMNFIAPGKPIIKTNKIGLIDADFIKYLVIHDIKKQMDNKEAMIFSDPVKHYTKIRVGNILNRFEAKGLIFCFSGPSEKTFRANVAFEKKYKGNRDYSPLYEGQEEDKMKVISYIKERYPSLLFQNLEADDLLSMLQDEDTFIFSKDKDLLQISGTHYNIEEEYLFEQTNSEAFKFLMYQLITGDSVDNITGLKGYGDAKAIKLLTDVHPMRMHNIVLNEYIKQNGLFRGVDMFVETWNLARLRDNRGDYFLSNYKSAFDLLRAIKNQE